MIITCPACAKRYLVEDTSIGEAGRQVQCIACQHEWFFKPLKDVPKHNQVHLDMIGIKSSVARTSMNLSFTWILMLSSLIVCFVGIYFARHTIALHFPQSIKIFQVIGLPVGSKPINLALENLKPYLESNQESNMLHVKGELINNSDQIQPIPTLKITVRGDCSKASFIEKLNSKIFKKGEGVCAIAKWTFTPPGDHLFPGEKLDFETYSDQYIDGAQSINVKF